VLNERWFRLNPEQSQFYPFNRDRFRERHPEAAVAVEAKGAGLADYEFLQVGPDRYACRLRENQRPLYDAANFKQRLETAFSNAMTLYQRGAELLAIAGAGLGYAASHLEEAIRPNHALGMILVENRPELILAQWCLFDCLPLIESTQVYWAVGEPFRPALERVVMDECLYRVREGGLVSFPERILTSDERREFRSIESWFAERQKQAVPLVQQKQTAFFARMAEAANLDSGAVWGVAEPDAYAHTPLIRSLMGGFETLGWKQRLLEIKDGFSTSFRVAESLIDASPDLILVCNDASGSFLSKEIRRPRVCWFLDRPDYYGSHALERDLSPRDFAFYLDRHYASAFEEANAGCCRFMPATSSFTGSGVRRDDLSVPILFVGSYQDVSLQLSEFTSKQKDEILELCDVRIQSPTISCQKAIEAAGLSEETLEAVKRQAQIYTAHIQNRFPSDMKQIDYYLYSLSNSVKRERTVKALLEFGIVVYGPDSWRSVLGTQYASQFKGWLKGEALADVYASADICLNVHSLQCPTCLNPRDFDVLTAGGCLVSDWVEDMDRDLIQPGLDCLTYRNEDELRDVVQELLDDPDRRESMREHGHATFFEHHTPAHRAQEILSIVKERYRET